MHTIINDPAVQFLTVVFIYEWAALLGIAFKMKEKGIL